MVFYVVIYAHRPDDTRVYDYLRSTQATTAAYIKP